MVDPKLPSPKEVEDHRLMGYVVYRNWCPIFVKLPEYAWDFCFPGDELGMKWTVLVGVEKMSGATMATALPEKGRGEQIYVGYMFGMAGGEWR